MEQLTIALPTEEDTLALAARLSRIVPDGVVIFLQGTLGAGKTTFTRGVLRGLGYAGKVKSPTYTLVEPYEIAGRFIYHFDLYRLNTADELKQLGVEEYFSPSTICLVEWPEKGGTWLPKPDLVCDLIYDGDGRAMRMMANSVRGHDIIAKLNVSS